MDGSDAVDALFGGVCDRVPSAGFILDEVGSVLSGEREEAACGTELSNISARNSVENVRFASSAVIMSVN